MRKTCRSCNSTRLVDVISLGEQYLSDFVDKKVIEKPDKYPLEVVMCQDCTLLQLKHTAPPDKLYNNNYGYRSGINNTIRADLKDIVTKALQIKEWKSKDYPLTVIDIGANDGTLLANYPPLFWRIGVEPVQKLAKDCEAHANNVINDFFSYEVLQPVIRQSKADIVTFISCFYDLEDPNKVVADLAKLLADDGILIIQQNYAAGMVKQNAFDNIVHEHLEFYTLKSLENLLNRHGLEVFDVETNSINGGSFRTYIRHMDSVKKMRLFEEKLKLDNRWTYMLFGMQVRQAVRQLYEFVTQEHQKGKRIYLYGASTRGNTLIQAAGLDNTLITAAVERNPEKWGKKIASTDIPIISEEQARLEKPDYMLVLPWFFKSEFIEREKQYLEDGGQLIFPLPKFEVVCASQ